MDAFAVLIDSVSVSLLYKCLIDSVSLLAASSLFHELQMIHYSVAFMLLNVVRQAHNG